MLDIVPQFEPGKLLYTDGVANMGLTGSGIVDRLARHVSKDWGDISPDDIGLNEKALQTGTRLFSVYKTRHGTLWAITEANRSSTTLLLPDEY